MGADRPASTSSRKARVCGSSVASKAYSRELPPGARREEIAIGGTAMPPRRRAACTLQHELAAHELAVVLADRAFGRCEAGVGTEGAPGPLPDIAEHSATRARYDCPGLVE